MVPTPLHELARSTYAAVAQATSHWRSLPDFIVVGGQRCGTTSLFKNLAEHPQVLRPGVEKGVDYFTLHYWQDLDWYRGHFPLTSLAQARRRHAGGPVVFEACTYYMFHPFALERLAADLPDVKIVAMLRDPVERAFSAFKHEVARGFETVTDFGEALALEETRLEGEVEKMRTDLHYESHPHRHQAYRARGQYAEQLQRAYDLFPAEHIHVCDSESYFAEPHEEYTKIREFLGLRDFVPPRFDQFNARPSKPMPPDLKAMLQEHYRPHDEALFELLGRRPRWMLP